MPRTKKSSSRATADGGEPIGTPLAQARRRERSPVFAHRMRTEPQDAKSFMTFRKAAGFKHFEMLAERGFLDVCEYYATTRLAWEEIRRGRATVERQWLEQSGPRTPGEQHRLSKRELNRLFVLYDWHFFGGAFERLLSEKAQKLEIVQPAALSTPNGEPNSSGTSRTSRTSRTSAVCIRNASGSSCTYTIELTQSVGYYFDPGAVRRVRVLRRR